MLTASIRLDKEKKIYKTVNNEELNVTYNPLIVTMLATEYQDKYSKLIKLIKDYQKTQTIELADELSNLSTEFADIGYKIIMTCLKANGKNVDETWINTNLMSEELHLLASYIIGTATDDVPKKETIKKKSKKTS